MRPVYPDHTPRHTRTGSARARLKAWGVIKSFWHLAPTRSRRRMLMNPRTAAGINADKYVTSGLSANSLQRIASWLTKFKAFLRANMWELGHSRLTPAMAQNNDLALSFLASVADENSGRTRIASAIRAINFVRGILGVDALSTDPRISLLKEGILRSNPHAPKGAMPIHPIMVLAIARTWGNSSVWWMRMTALLMLASFLSLLRAAGFLTAPRASVTWVLGQREVTNPSSIPAVHDGVLLLIPSRKSSQTAPSWVPLRGGRVTQLLKDHLHWCKRTRLSNPFLFPARKTRYKSKTRVWVPHETRRLSRTSMVFLMRKALVEVCGVSEASARRFTAHSLRVGGINNYRRMGVSLGMCAQIASHKSLTTSRTYLRLLPVERLDELRSMVSL